MNIFIAGLVGFTLLMGVPVFGQEKYDQHGAQKPAAVEKRLKAAKSAGMKCCEGMEKMGGMKDGMPMKGDMKAKLENMKEMKVKMAETMKLKARDKTPQSPASKSQEDKSAEQAPHQH